MIETNDYWIVENKFIFKPYFSKSLNSYIALISQYEHLIFSNYTDYVLCIELDNKFDDMYREQFKKSRFSKPYGHFCGIMRFYYDYI